MIKPELIDELKSRSSTIAELSEESLSYEGADIELTPYDLVNMALVQQQVMSEAVQRMAIVCPPDRVTPLLGVLAAALALCELDLKDRATDLITALKPRDPVKLDGYLGRYIRYDPDLGFCVEFRNPKGPHGPTWVYIKKTEAHRLLKYEGNARTLNYWKPGKRKTDVSARFIARVMGKDVSDVTSVLHKRRLVFVGNWGFAESLGKLRIHGEEFGDVFPTAYFSSPEHSRHVGHRASQKKPNVCIVPNLSVARDLARSGADESIHLLLIGNASSLGGHAATLDQIGVERVIVYKRASEWAECGELEETGFRIWFWSDRDLRQAVSGDGGGPVRSCVVEAQESEEQGEEMTRQLHTVRPGASRMEVLHVRMPDAWGHKAGDVERHLRALEDISTDLRSKELRKFVGLGWIALINASSFPYPPEEVSLTGGRDEDVVARLLKRLRDLAPHLDGRVLVGEMRDLPGCVITGLESLRSMIGRENPRAMRVIEWATQVSRAGLVVVRDASFVEPTRAFIKDAGANACEVMTPRDIATAPGNADILYTAWPGRKQVVRLHDCPPRNYTFLLADHEQPFFNTYVRSRQSVVERYTDPTVRSGLLGTDERFFLQDRIQDSVHGELCEEAVEDPDDVLSRILDLGGPASSSSGETGSAEEVEAYRVDFEEKAHGYFTEGFTARVIDRVTGRLEAKRGSELQVGDELVFACGSSRDIFETLVSQVESRPEMSEVVQLSQLWWQVLHEYMRSSGKGIGDVMNELSDRGFCYEPATILAWVQGERIRPSKYAVIEAIAEITGSEALARKLKDVRRACGRRLAVHIRLGKYLVQQITRAVTKDRGEKIDEAFRPIADELARHAEVVTVCAVADTPSQVARSVSNRLIRDREEMWVDLFETIEEI